MTDANPAADQVFDGKNEKGKIEDNLKSKPAWLRLLFMIFYAIAFNVAAIVGSLVVVTGFIVVLVTGRPNDNLRRSGGVLASYLAEIVNYLTYNTDVKPFPFGNDSDKDDNA